MRRIRMGINMINESDIQSFVKAANSAGRSCDLSQAAGGNISIKINPDIMLIKSSGIRLRDVRENNGISAVSYNSIKDKIFNFRHKGNLQEIIGEYSLPFNGRMLKPSIETGFHSLLDKAVIHIHSVYANFLSSSTDAEKLCKKLFPEAVFVEYNNPGEELCYAIKEKLSAGMKSQIMFLANHGLVATGENFKDALSLIDFVNGKIKEYFSLPVYCDKGEISAYVKARFDYYGKDYVLNNKLLLEQDIYCGAKQLKTPFPSDTEEVLAAYFYLMDAYKNTGLYAHLIK